MQGIASIRAKINIAGLLTLIATIALFFALRGWWIRSQDPSKTLLVPIILAAMVAVVSSTRGKRTIYTALLAALTAFLATSAVSIETICMSKPTAFMRAHHIIARYHTDVGLNVTAIVFVTGICFVGGVILGLSSAAIRNLFRRRSLSRIVQKE